MSPLVQTRLRSPCLPNLPSKPASPLATMQGRSSSVISTMLNATTTIEQSNKFWVNSFDD